MGKVNEIFTINICFRATCEVENLCDSLTSTITLTYYFFGTQS